MIIQRDSMTQEDSNEFIISVVPMPSAFLIQINSSVLRGTFVMDHSLEEEDMKEVFSKVFGLIDEVSMRSLTDEDEIPQ